MTRAKTVGVSAEENYDYNKFLEDSSDDYPKYADGLNLIPAPVQVSGTRDQSESDTTEESS